MPKLDGTHITERLKLRLEQLHRGEDVARRELESLFTKEQIEAWDAAWDLQRQLRKAKRARTKEEEIRLGWKSKRDVTIQFVQDALAVAQNNLNLELKNLHHKSEVRRSRIFLDSYFSAIDKGKDRESAWLFANNDLTRAGLNRLDGKPVTKAGLRRRDSFVADLEKEIDRQALERMSDEERRVWEEQLTVLDEIDVSRSKSKKR
jgi:hypothetical protein